MRHVITIAVAALVACVGARDVSAQSPRRIAAEGGDIIITPIVHASVQLEHAGRVIHVDPWSAGDLSRAALADLILVTDDPGHHLDPEAIARLRKPGAPVVVTAAGEGDVPGASVLANGERRVFAGIPVEATPAYDMTPGQPLHPRGEANGYVLTLGGQRIFFAGVTECVPEIQALRNIDVAFLPMNLPVDRMRPIPVAECIRTFAPKVVYLYHYDNRYARWLQNPQGAGPEGARETAATIEAFKSAIADLPVEFHDGPWYPPVTAR